MKTFIVVVNTEEREGSPLAAALHQGYGDEYVTGYLRSKMPAGSPLHIVSSYQVGVEQVLSDGERDVLLNPKPVSASRRDDGPRYF